MKTFTTRDWVYIAVFGALWGAIEINLGAYLHVIFPPLADSTNFGGIGVSSVDGAAWTLEFSGRFGGGPRS